MTRETDDLLLLFVSGAATAEERARVAAALQEEPALEEDLRFWRHVQEGVLADAPRPPPDAWARLELALDASEAKAAPSSSIVGNVVPADRRHPANVNVPGAPSSWWRPLAVAACLLLAVQSAFMLQSGSKAPSRAPEGSLTTASGEIGSATGGAEADRVLQVTFRPDATEASIRALLLDVAAVLVDGPSAIGVYRIAFATPEARGAGLEALRAHGDVIESAAP